ncbi:TetR/AcrR family transcriptional regulator [Nocardia alni]|uniref:TetR/AcrR family transcriptional regulator n=1 Tax=Nocardia alni TaxID=2815723 RepID=UPI001C246B7C|nr:TetR/AcrR family transcriptional regulator [Nocardia alni]
MATGAKRSERRREPLTRERVVGAAIELLDASGEGGLTFRALSHRLSTGPGAIYWHVPNKDELLDAATDSVIAAALTDQPVAVSTDPPGRVEQSPRERVRTVALGLFEAIDEHPWLGAQLATQVSRNPWRSASLRIFDRIGQQVLALGVPGDGQFLAASALMQYILGAAGQNAANGRSAVPGMDRGEFLDSVSTAWESLDADDYPFARVIGDQLRDHDDREQFLAGIDLILAGITVVYPPTTRSDSG